MAESLRGQLTGAWKLVLSGDAGGRIQPFEPLGPEPRGIIMYTPDGYMSAQLRHEGILILAAATWCTTCAGSTGAGRGHTTRRGASTERSPRS